MNDWVYVKCECGVYYDDPSYGPEMREEKINECIGKIEEKVLDIVTKDRTMFLRDNIFDFLSIEDIKKVRTQCRKEIADEMKTYMEGNYGNQKRRN